MTGTLLAILPAAMTAIATGLAVNPVLRRLPEPARADGARSDPARSDPARSDPARSDPARSDPARSDPARSDPARSDPRRTRNPAHDDKIAYSALADRRFAVGCGLVTFALCFTSWALLPPQLQAPWTVLATLGVVLALVDLRTTWLPMRLTHLGWLLMVAALGLTAVLTGGHWLLVRGLSGAIAAGALYWLVWAASRGGFGFGDVRYAPLIGAATSAESWAVWGWALLLGSVAGAVVGVLRLMRGRRGSFPYAPSMLLGCYLAVAASALT